MVKTNFRVEQLLYYEIKNNDWRLQVTLAVLNDKKGVFQSRVILPVSDLL